jgi:hypothetical protein
MAVKTQITDSAVYKQHYSMHLKKINRRNRIVTIVVGVVFGGISTWFWSGYHR